MRFKLRLSKGSQEMGNMKRILTEATILLGFGLAGISASGQVTPERLLESAKEPQNWLMYSGDYAGRRYSTLDQINAKNAASLVPKWAYQTMAGGKFETTSLVVDGVLYATGADDRALDRKSTRLNSSHGYISYAVFCLKKKKKPIVSSLPVTTVEILTYINTQTSNW